VETYYFGRVLHGHNNRVLTFPEPATADIMILQCLAHCAAMFPKCWETDVVYDKKTCYFSTSGGFVNDLKVDLDAVAFFMYEPINI
jgi:hypothetical protein